MQSYQYKYGDKPLEGYTIQRAVGRGGFGEVYYAVSDAGREVALKEVQAWEQIELRGIQQCMNLKNPHLVTIFDVKHSDKRKPFVIMEYVSGPSLADIIQESPNGLGTAKTAYFIKEICKGLGYLHDCGIVHRDLKPSNIFYDNGVVKIGDYGLSKAINTSRYSNQTITVGTVHYMAPEVGAGKYDRSIDIYALGVMCYEMLTGKVPYAGESPAEILLKHLNSQPDLTGIDPVFARVIKKAMSPNPEDRYHTVGQIVDDLFGSQQVQQSMSQFNPLDLSAYAARTAEKMLQAQDEVKPKMRPDTFEQRMDAAGQRFEAAGKRFQEAGNRIAGVFDRFTNDEYKKMSACDSLSRKQRIILALILSAVISCGVGFFLGFREDDAAGISVTTLTMIIGGGGAILLARKRLLKEMEPNVFRNWATAAFALLGAGLLSAASWQDAPSDFEKLAKGTFLSLVVLGLADFWKMTDFYRNTRVTISTALMLGVPAFIIAMIFHGQPLVSFAVISGICLFVQVIWPYVNPAAVQQQTANPPQPTINPPQPRPSSDRENTRRGIHYSADSSTAAGDVSPFNRVWAMLFSAGIFIGIGGLQRFYVGKIGTGILWFFTGGLFLVGQVIDFIMIITGNFKDKQGRRLVMWEGQSPYYNYNPAQAAGDNRVSPYPAAGQKETPTAQAQQVQYAQPPSPRQPTTVILKDPNADGSFISGFCAFTGYNLLVLGMLIIYLGMLHIPQIIFSTMPADMTEHMQSLWGTPNWKVFFEQIVALAGYLMVFLSLVLIIVARRRHGAAHIMRAVIATGLLVLSVVVCNENSNWNTQMPVLQDAVPNPPGYPIQQPVGVLIERLFFLIAAIVLLAWPPKRIPPQIVMLNPDGSNQILPTEL